MNESTLQRVKKKTLNLQVSCLGCFFGCAITSQARELIEQNRRFKLWEKGQYLFQSGDPAHGIWSVCTGKVKVFQDTEQGKHLTVRIAISGELIGHRSVLAGTTFSASAITLEETRTAYLPTPVVMKLIEIEPAIRAKLFQHLADELGRAENLATSMAYNKAEQRLLWALAQLCRSCADESPVVHADHFDIPAPRQELAELSGLTVEATVRTIRRLEEQGIIKAHGHSIHILKPHILGDFY